MPNEMIPFPYEIKITHSDFCCCGIYYSNKDRHGGSVFLFYFFILIIMALGRKVWPRNLTDQRKH